MTQQIKKDYLQSKDKRHLRFNQYPIKQQVIQLLHSFNFRKPTLVQAQSLPITLQQNLKDLCVITYAYNGAGKTLSYLIPILNSLEMIPDKGVGMFRDKQVEIYRPQAIIISPTEALMSQVFDNLEGYADYYYSRYKWKLNVGLCYGSQTRNGHIIVGMTQKVSTFINSPHVDLSQLKWVVFDQCDQIKQDQQDRFKIILKTLSTNQQINGTNLLITSATGQKVKFRQFIQQNLASHNVVQLDSKQQNKGLIGVSHYFAPSTNKTKTIYSILQRLSKMQKKIQVIIFFNQRKQLMSFYEQLKKQQNSFVINDNFADTKGKNNIMVDYVHGRCGSCMGDHLCPDDCVRTKTQRVQRLRDQEIQVLLGTETIGRGIDIRTVSLVINYSQPKKPHGGPTEYSPITYIHRVGRTGRYSDQGVALIFVENELFINQAQKDQKIQFIAMKNQQHIIDQALRCSTQNQKITQGSKLRWQ